MKSKVKQRFLLPILLSLILAIGALFVVPFGALSAYAAEAEAKIENELKIHFVDVGQGDACVIELPDGRNMLIDSGKSDSKNTLIHYIENNIKSDDGQAIEYFDIAVMTHSDEDHCGEMKDVLSKFPAKTFYRPNQEATYTGYTDPGKADLYGDYNGKNTAAYKNAIEAGYNGAEQAFVTNPFDDRQNLITPEGKSEGDEGYYSITFYGPVKEKYGDYNNYSPIMILEYEGNRIALSGDAEKEGEADFVAKASEGEGKYAIFNDTFSVNVIKLGHHGSRTSSSEDYLEVMTTEQSRPYVLAIISCGEGNTYGHPHAEVLTRLKDMGFADENVLRTDKLGDIVLSIRYDEGQEKFVLFNGANSVTETPETPTTPTTPDKPTTPDTPTTPDKPTVPEKPTPPERPEPERDVVYILGVEIERDKAIIIAVIVAVIVVVVFIILVATGVIKKRRGGRGRGRRRR